MGYRSQKATDVSGETMSVIDDFEAAWLAHSGPRLSLLLCLYTGPQQPDYCSAMPRDPPYSIGIVFGARFLDDYAAAIATNPAIHDGAVLIGRSEPTSLYRVQGWSMRLYPPPLGCVGEPNRGSAFNSCLEMSRVPRIDRMYLVSAGRLYCFITGVKSTIGE